MKITAVETLIADGGWRPWIFIKVSSDRGVVGYGECSDGRNPRAIAGAVEDLTPLLLGQDPRAFELRYWDMLRATRQSPGGIAAKAVAGIELALLDLKARALGVSVAELFGGPTRDSVRLYWSHCGTSRVLLDGLLDTPPLVDMAAVADLGREVVAAGYDALKTNVLMPGDPATVYMPGFSAGPGSTDQAADNAMLAHIDTLIGTLRDAVGPEVDLCLDLNFNFKPEAVLRIAKLLEPYRLLWLEVDMYRAEALAQIRAATDTRICSGENLYYMSGYLPYFQQQAADIYMIDVPWNGFAPSKKVADLAEVFQLNVAPHNYYSHLSTFISAALCATAANVRIMETDVDDVPWKDELVTVTPTVRGGRLQIPTGPGWGTELVEGAVAARPWRGPLAGWAKPD